MAVSINNSIEAGLERFFAYLPQILGALLILLIGYIVAKALQTIVRKSLHKVRFDRALHTSSAGKYISRVIETPSAFAGRLTYWLIMLAFISFAVTALNLPVLDHIINGIYSYVPHVIAAIVIFFIAGALSTGIVGLVRSTMGRTTLARVISTTAPAVIMGIASFMILDELKVAPHIVNTTFNAIMYSLALGLALAFGLGGRDVAKDMLEQAYQAGRSNADAVKMDLNMAKTRAKRKFDDELSA